MMNCASFENRLTELLDGETVVTSRDATLAELRQHVEECPDCGEKVYSPEAMPARIEAIYDTRPLAGPQLLSWRRLRGSE